MQYTPNTLRDLVARLGITKAGPVLAALNLHDKGLLTEEQAADRIARTIAGVPLRGAVPGYLRAEYRRARADLETGLVPNMGNDPVTLPLDPWHDYGSGIDHRRHTLRITERVGKSPVAPPGSLADAFSDEPLDLPAKPRGWLADLPVGARDE